MTPKDSEHTAAFLRTVAVLAEGIYEVVQEMGDDDTRQYTRDAVDQLKDAIDNYITDNLLPKTPLPEKGKPGYQRNGDFLSYINEQHAMGKHGGRKLDPDEKTRLWQYRFYEDLLERIKRDEKIVDCISRQDLWAYIDAELVPRTIGKDYFSYKETADPGDKVVNDAVDYVLEQRKKAPQAKLFS